MAPVVEEGTAEDGAATDEDVDGDDAGQAPTAPRATAPASLSSPLHSTACAALLALWRET